MNRWRSSPAPGRCFAGKGNRSMKVIIVGGVAGGASCAARLRRLDESAEILMVERGPYVSYANCGLPYHVGGVIKEEASLLVATAELFRDRFAIDVRTSCEATEILPKEKKVRLRDVRTGEVSEHAYDKLVLSPGAAFDPPAAAGDRPSGHLPCPHGARRPPDQRMDRVAPHRFRRPEPSPSRRRPWSWAAASSAWRWPRTWSIAASR